MMKPPFRPDCFYCRGQLRHTEAEHDRATRDFEGVLMRVRGEWYARAVESWDRDLMQRAGDVRLAATSPGRRRKNSETP